MKLSKMTKFVAAAALTLSAAVMATPDEEKSRIYYSDASKTVAVGEKLVTVCGVGIVNVMVWGTTSSYYTNTSTPCGGNPGPGDEDPIHCDYFRDVFC